MKKKRWLKIALNMFFAALFIGGVVITLRQYVYFKEPYTPPPPTPHPAPSTAVSAAISTPHSPAETLSPSPTPYVRPILPAPTKLYFIRQEISCEILPVPMLEEDGVLSPGTLDDHMRAAWNMEGPVPGEPGIAHINGHISKDGVLGTFHILRDDMVIGDEIAIEYEDGSVRYFNVEKLMTYTLDEFPTELLLPNWGGEPLLSLVTCKGDWDRKLRTHDSRALVMCRFVEGEE